MKRTTAIICAAGKGERAGFGKNKLLVPLYGAPALYHTLKKFNVPEIDEVIVTSSLDDYAEISALAAPFGYKVVVGGDTRTQSVKNALAAATGEVVLIHDGARPFVSRKQILGCIDSVLKYGSGICAVKATDTAIYAPDGAKQERLDRNFLYLAQTPQGFFTEDIRRAYSLAEGRNYTDDSAVYAEFIAPPHFIEGGRDNVKLTFGEDFSRGLPPAVTTAGNASDKLRTGFGVDVHAFGEGDHVKLAGVKIDCDRGLIAHSDGDVVIHAVMDALLSAAGLKDIGHYFPETDDRFSGADSGKLLEKVVKILRREGYEPVNISVSVQAEKPRLSGHIGKMTERLSALTGILPENVAIAAGTCEGLGFVGEGLGITAYCNALIIKR